MKDSEKSLLEKKMLDFAKSQIDIKPNFLNTLNEFMQDEMKETTKEKK